MRCSLVWTIGLVLVALPKPGRLVAGNLDAEAAAKAITHEATLPNGAAAGRPLPLAAHWNTGHYSRAKGMDGGFLVSLVEQGHHVLPGFHLAMPPQDGFDSAYYEAPIKRAAELNVPITLVATQWERILTADKRWFDLPPDENPNAVGLTGTVQKRVSPAVRSVGHRHGTEGAVRSHPGPRGAAFVRPGEYPPEANVAADPPRRRETTWRSSTRTRCSAATACARWTRRWIGCWR